MADDLVMVSVKMPRSLYARLQAYARAHRYTVSELLRDGVEWRLGEEADPLAYRFGATGNTSTGDMEPSADQEQSAVERHQAIMGLLREIREHQRAPQPVEPLPVPVGTVIPVIPVIPEATDVVVRSIDLTTTPPDVVIPVIPPEGAYDPTVYVLGKGCTHWHFYQGTGKTLRYRKGGQCVVCLEEQKQRQPAHAYDPTKFLLGPLCQRGHDYEGTGQSLRYVGKRECVQCKRINSAKAKQKAQAPVN